MTLDVTITDHFSGAGGSSQGAEAVEGVTLKHAINHWKLALQSHNENFPHADHSITNLSTVNPAYFARTTLAWFSPACTFHSQARGDKRRLVEVPDEFGETLPEDAGKRSRATMMDVVRFSEHHRYEAVVVENVVDVMFWEGIDEFFRRMKNVGYKCKVLFLNSMHFPAGKTLGAPQSRDRVYIVFWLAGNPDPDLEFRPMAYCPRCDRAVRAMQVFKPRKKTWPAEEWGRYGPQYYYRCPAATCAGVKKKVEPFVLPAAAAIDWSMPGQRIGDRKTPLRPATLARIRLGLLRHAVPAMVPAGGGWNTDTWPVTEPMRTRTTRETEGLAIPPGWAPESAFLTAYYKGETKADPATRPLRTLTTVDRMGVAFIAELRGGGSKLKCRSVYDPLATVTANGNHHMLVRNNGTKLDGSNGQMCTPVTEPGRTITTAGHQSLVGWPPHLDLARFGVGGNGVIEDRGDLPPGVADSTFRMLEPDEIRKAMSFADGYVLLGTRRERIKQLGNAVTPPAAEWIIGQITESLGLPAIEYREYQSNEELLASYFDLAA